MPDIRHHVGINAPLSEVYAALATRDGIAQWWTTSIDGESAVGEELTFRFGQPEPAAVMKVVELVPDTLVSWQCVVGPDEWLDTLLTFELKPNGDETARLPSSRFCWRPMSWLGSNVLSFDIASTSPVLASSTTADRFAAPDASLACCTCF